MKYKNKEINLMNFSEEFKDASPELLDEVVTSIVYNVELGPFIEKFPDKPGLLKQIKWGILENIPIRYFNIGNEKVLKKLRATFKQGLNITKEDLSTLTFLEEELACQYIDWLSLGIPMKGYKLTNLNINTAKNLTPYLKRGFNCMDFCNGREYSSVYIGAVLELKSKGVDVRPFLNRIWSENVLTALLNKQNLQLVEKLVKVVSPDTDLQAVNALYNLFNLGIYPKNLLKKQKDRVEVSRLNIIFKAYQKGLDWQEFDSPETELERLENRLQVRETQHKSKKITL